MQKLRLWIFGLIAFLLFSFHHVKAEQKVTSGDYDVHYMVMNSRDLLPAIARDYQLLRKDNMALVNIAVRKKQVGNMDQAVAAQLKGSARNLLGQKDQLEFREVKESNAVYYLAQFTFSHREDMNFEFQVTPAGESRPIMVKFSQRMYIIRK